MAYRLGFIVLTGLGVACGAAGEEARPPEAQPHSSDVNAVADAALARPTSCPETLDATHPLPGVTPEAFSLDYWLERQATYGAVDDTLLTAVELGDHSAALRVAGVDGVRGQADLLAPIDEAFLLTELQNRLAFMHERIADERYLSQDGSPLSEPDAARFAQVEALPTLRLDIRVALQPLSLRCGPREQGLYTESLDPLFDRNACSTIRAQEPIQVIAAWPGDLLWVRTRYAMGWLPASADLSAPIAEPDVTRFIRGPHAQLLSEVRLASASNGHALTAGTLVPVVAEPDDSIYFATRSGVESAPTDNIRRTQRALSRRALFEEAFTYLNGPYGWGGHEGGRDCSRFLLDLFETFGLHLPRHSATQSRAGTFSVDVSGVEGDNEKLLLIEEAARKGIVLLYLPGHIMLYLGQTDEGTPMALHSFAEYISPCPGAGSFETLHRVHRVTISDLELGRGSSRRAFIERITRVVVIGAPPGLRLQGPAELRAAAPVTLPADDACQDSLNSAIFRSPRRPNAQSVMRVIATSEHDPGPVDLTLFSPSGERVQPEVHRLGAPPWSYWSSIEEPEAGMWTAVLGDGERIEACERFRVAPHRPRGRGGISEVAWTPSWRWERDTENLFSAFVEQLFRAPENEDVTWPNLQVLIDDPARNLLHDHIVRGDDARLRLHPDCADLPYFLRAYFAWKLRLPFAFRRCNRGREGRPPTCGAIESNMDPLEEPADDITRGRDFIRRVGSGVHSGTARTLPSNTRADLYPVPLTRETLRPGTVYADPYGHLLVIARWQPQGTSEYGVLIGADAQPDATVGRRRFWRGSFLFTPDTTSVGAGFKAWRPIIYRGASRPLIEVSNRDLASSTRHTPWSNEQYDGTADEFYERMDALINPRPLDAFERLSTLVDALFESVQRRLNSVNNGEEFMSGRGWRTVEMPTGYHIFETSGPWEDFSTPSRDMRLLISMDAVTAFPAIVARHPTRFGFGEEEGAEAQRRLESALRTSLESRTFEYNRSDGSPWPLNLHELAQRQEALEMAYNPNDCVEIRWAAPEGSTEYAPCQRHAPEFQRDRMQSYRPWFVARERPPR